jgi:hypothetical protein
MKRYYAVVFSPATICLVLVTIAVLQAKSATQSTSQFLGSAGANSINLIDQGRQIFRFDTYGDEAFWTEQLQMQKAVQTLSPATALSLGLKVDSQALTAAQGRFKTLLDVVNSYDQRFSLGLTDREKHDLVEYLKSL